MSTLAGKTIYIYNDDFWTAEPRLSSQHVIGDDRDILYNSGYSSQYRNIQFWMLDTADYEYLLTQYQAANTITLVDWQGSSYNVKIREIGIVDNLRDVIDITCDRNINLGAAKDNTLRVFGGQLTLNYGASDTLAVRYSMAGYTNTVIQFNSLALDSLSSATLQLQVTAHPGGNITVTACRILVANADWPEGSSDGVTETGASCGHSHTYATQSWAGSYGCNTTGVDYASPALGSFIITGTGRKDITLNATEVKKMLDGTYTNAGIILKTPNILANDFVMTSRESSLFKPSLALAAQGACCGVKVRLRCKVRLQRV